MEPVPAFRLLEGNSHNWKCFTAIISIPGLNCFTKRPPGAKLHALSKLYDVPIGFVAPPPHLRQCIALYAIAEGWMLLDIG